MIIECPACRARFKLDEDKIKGRGARVRCRRCGEAIVVLKPEESRAEAEKDAVGNFLDLRSVVRESMEEKAEEASREPSLPAGIPERKDEAHTALESIPASGGTEEPSPGGEEKESDALPDLAVDFRPEEKIDLDRPAEPPKESAAPDFLIGGMETLDFLREDHGGAKEGERRDISTSLRREPEDLLVPAGIPEPPTSPAPESMTAVAAPAESAPDAPVPTGGQVPGEAFRPKPPGPRRAASPAFRPSLIALVLLFVALAGGGAYLGFTKSGQDLLRGLVPGMESLWLRGAGKPGPQFDVRNLIGYFERNTRAGNLFVIRGQVVNMGRTRKSGIRVRAALLDGKDQPLSERTSYAGTVLSGETLRTASREKIEEALSNRFGDKLVNMDVAPGKSVPFMVVFFNAPEGIGAYRLEAKDSD
jgi:predicted Zn finger-like uncharacterized protein